MSMTRRVDGRELVGGCPHEIFYISPSPIELDGPYIRINRAGITTQTQPEFHIERDDTYRFNIIHCVTRGSGSVTLGGKRRPLSVGQVFVLPAQERHAYRSDPDNPMGLSWVEFAGGNSTQLMRHIIASGGIVYGEPVFQEALNLCTYLFYQREQNIPQNSQILYQILMTFCAHLEQESRLDTPSQAFLKYIDENLGKKLTLTQVAQHFGYHPAYFSAYFSKSIGMTFSKYVMARRMRQACYLLSTTQWPIERVSQELGFYDVSHFIQRFKAAEGLTPSRYRKEN